MNEDIIVELPGLTVQTGGGGGSATWGEIGGNIANQTDLANALNAKGTYSKPTDGIPKSDLSSAIQESLNKADTALQTHQSLVGYATENWVEGKGYLTEHQSLSGYATENWVENKGYLTEHQSLEGYATEEYVDEAIAGVSGGDIQSISLNGSTLPIENHNVNIVVAEHGGMVTFSDNTMHFTNVVDGTGVTI